MFFTELAFQMQLQANWHPVACCIISQMAVSRPDCLPRQHHTSISVRVYKGEPCNEMIRAVIQCEQSTALISVTSVDVHSFSVNSQQRSSESIFQEEKVQTGFFISSSQMLYGDPRIQESPRAAHGNSGWEELPFNRQKPRAQPKLSNFFSSAGTWLLRTGLQIPTDFDNFESVTVKLYFLFMAFLSRITTKLYLVCIHLRQLQHFIIRPTMGIQSHH